MHGIWGQCLFSDSNRNDGFRGRAAASGYRHEVAMARRTDHMVLLCVDEVVHTSCGWLKQLALSGKGCDVTCM